MDFLRGLDVLQCGRGCERLADGCGLPDFVGGNLGVGGDLVWGVG